MPAAEPDPDRSAARIEHGVGVYGAGDAEIRALDGVTRAFPARVTAIMGPSGVLFLSDGRVVDELATPTPTPILDRMETLSARV